MRGLGCWPEDTVGASLAVGLASKGNFQDEISDDYSNLTLSRGLKIEF